MPEAFHPDRRLADIDSMIEHQRLAISELQVQGLTTAKEEHLIEVLTCCREIICGCQNIAGEPLPELH